MATQEPIYMCPAVRHCLNPVWFVCSSLSQCSGNTGMPSSNVEQRSCVRGGGGEQGPPVSKFQRQQLEKEKLQTQDFLTSQKPEDRKWG